MHRNSVKLMTYFRDKYIDGSEMVLDIGCAKVANHPSYRPLFAPKYVGMDIIPARNVDIVGYENITDVFDVVISGQVMEHVSRPWDWLKSLTQYFTKYICIIAPNAHHEHRHPLDTYRYYPDGMRDLFEYAGIKELEIFKNSKDTIGIGTK